MSLSWRYFGINQWNTSLANNCTILVNPNEGDSYPLGALSKGTKVHCIEKMPGTGAHYVLTAGSTATILRQVDDRVIVQLASKLQVSLSKECMATVGESYKVFFLLFISTFVLFD